MVVGIALSVAYAIKQYVGNLLLFHGYYQGSIT